MIGRCRSSRSTSRSTGACPAFLIATVDKFAVAAVGWRRRACCWAEPTAHDATGFYGAAEPGKGTRLATPLAPPDLIIQDELHLISGPLGTMAGLYEAAIDGSVLARSGRPTVRPKIVASTATVRRAADQIQALFARSATQVFPPPGTDRRDSFFARTVPPDRAPARLYIGVAAQGRNPKVVLRRTWLALMGAAERAYRDAGGHRNEDNPADPYMTVMGYFNSLRELGGCRRILEEEVRNTVKSYRWRASALATTAGSSRTARPSPKLSSSPRACRPTRSLRRGGGSSATSTRNNASTARSPPT